jgi:hypothetical protein
MAKCDNQVFNAVKDQIGFCGIYCGSCIVGNGVLRELTKRYHELTTAYGLKEWGPKNFDYDQFAKGLSSISTMPLCPGCLKGGGRDDCEIRACAQSKQVEDCGECSEPGDCAHSDLLERMRSGAEAAGIFVKRGTGERRELLEEWVVELRQRWPCRILFDGEE